VISVPVNGPDAAKVIAEPKISYPGDPANTFDPGRARAGGFQLVDGVP
jgi:hypothetical protein